MAWVIFDVMCLHKFAILDYPELLSCHHSFLYSMKISHQTVNMKFLNGDKIVKQQLMNSFAALFFLLSKVLPIFQGHLCCLVLDRLHSSTVQADMLARQPKTSLLTPPAVSADHMTLALQVVAVR